MGSEGLMICAMGIPGSGKTSVFKELSHFLSTTESFFEPEENDRLTPWPKAVSSRDKYGYFGSISWFRAMRVPLLYDAAKAAATGKIALVDSYYDKLLYNYLGKEGLDWFFPKNDIYYPVVEKMAELDYQHLPLADLVVFFSVNHTLWRQYCTNRDRDMDREDEFEKQCFSLQKPMISACEKYVKDYGKSMLLFEMEDSSPAVNAQKLSTVLLSTLITK